MSGFSIKVDLSGLDAQLDADAAAVEAATRPAAQAGAQVLYDEVNRNVSRIKRKTGNLARSIYQVYSTTNSSKARAVYHISWNARKAPHGHLVEYGHLLRYEISFDRATGRFITHKDRPLPTPRQVGARPFVRPAVSKFSVALQAASDRYLAELAEKGVVRS